MLRTGNLYTFYPFRNHVSLGYIEFFQRIIMINRDSNQSNEIIFLNLKFLDPNIIAYPPR